MLHFYCSLFLIFYPFHIVQPLYFIYSCYFISADISLLRLLLITFRIYGTVSAPVLLFIRDPYKPYCYILSYTSSNFMRIKKKIPFSIQQKRGFHILQGICHLSGVQLLTYPIIGTHLLKCFVYFCQNLIHDLHSCS